MSLSKEDLLFKKDGSLFDKGETLSQRITKMANEG
jgi:hypothetical protein